jgi:streptogramin lyase
MQSGFSGRRRPKRGVSTAFRTPSMGPGPGEIRGRRLRQGVLAATFAFSALMLIDPFASYDATLEAHRERGDRQPRMGG